jgi:YD repeat-containing protein
MKYNALGDAITMTDRNGNTHACSFDALDRFGRVVDQWWLKYSGTTRPNRSLGLAGSRRGLFCELFPSPNSEP